MKENIDDEHITSVSVNSEYYFSLIHDVEVCIDCLNENYGKGSSYSLNDSLFECSSNNTSLTIIVDRITKAIKNYQITWNDVTQGGGGGHGTLCGWAPLYPPSLHQPWQQQYIITKQLLQQMASQAPPQNSWVPPCSLTRAPSSKSCSHPSS